MNKIGFLSPLEQFDIVYVKSVFGLVDIANMELYFMVILLSLIYLVVSLKNNYIFFSSFLQYVFNQAYELVSQMVDQQATVDGYPYFPYMFVTFIFISFANVFGMLPFGFTITAHICITFFLAFAYNSAFVLIGLLEHKTKFFNLFVPSDAPKALVPLIVVIEVVSYMIRSFSLSIRLFANMMAGHCLLYVISGFAFSFLNSMMVVSIVPLAFVYIGIFILEFSIAFLQAYVFTILLCIYLKDSLHPGH